MRGNNNTNSHTYIQSYAQPTMHCSQSIKLAGRITKNDVTNNAPEPVVSSHATFWSSSYHFSTPLPRGHLHHTYHKFIHKHFLGMIIDQLVYFPSITDQGVVIVKSININMLQRNIRVDKYSVPFNFSLWEFLCTNTIGSKPITVNGLYQYFYILRYGYIQLCICDLYW